MTTQRSRWRVAFAATSSVAILLSGCGGSADPSTSTESAQANNPTHVVPIERPSGQTSKSGSATGHKRASSQPNHHSPQKPRRAAEPQSAAPSHPASPTKQTEDLVAKLRKLVGGSGGGKQRTASTPKEIHEVLQEVRDQSGGQASGEHESGGGNSPSSVEEVLESLGGS